MELEEDLKNLTFFTNEEGQKLEDRFKRTLKDVQYFDILVGYFRTSGFYRLYKDFENIDKIRILVGLNADKKAVEVISQTKQETFDFESHTETKKIISEQIEKEMYEITDNQEVEDGIHKFIEFLKSGKLEIKAHPSKNIHAKVYISRFKKDDRDYGRVITGSSNFSESGLNSQYEFNVELTIGNDVKYALKKFEKLWAEAVDLTETYIDTIKNNTWLNNEITPYEIYLKFLYENFEKRLADDDNLEIQYPNGFMELKYQKQAVSSLREIVDTYGGAFISDVVGLGKTYITAMYMQNLGGKKLVICPPPIQESWQDAIMDFGVRSATVESIGKLQNIIKKGYDKYDYIFVDEAHRFRNEDTAQYQLLNEICYGKKVILITATPLNNSIYDFFPLIKLFQNPKDSTIPGMKNLEQFFANIRNNLGKMDKSQPEYLEEVKNVSKVVRDKILKYILIRRTRTDIKEYYKSDIKQQGLFFPEVAEPKRVVYTFDEKTNDIFNQTIAGIKHLTYARYQPAIYLNTKLSAFEETQVKNLVGFMKTMLVKRLESSKYAFLQTISRFVNSYKNFIDMYKNGTVYISKKVDVFDFLDNESEEELIKELEKDEKAKVYPSQDFKCEFIEDLEKDFCTLTEIQKLWSSVEVDFKKEEFLKQLEEDKCLSDNRLIIFTESKETGFDLYNSLYEKYGKSVLFYSSGSCCYEGKSVSKSTAKELIHQNYDPKCDVKDDTVKFLITTDVLAEGINLHKSNVLINYDLPWNPTRVLQRVGRVNRVGTKHKEIFIYNFFPTSITDNQLNLEDNIKAKIQAFHETLGEDAKYLTEEETTTNHKLFGEKLYDTITNKDTYNEEDDDESSELKYLSILKDIQENNTELFNKIKKLPKKARTSKQYNVQNTSLITFFRKGKHFRTYLYDGTTTKELIFDDAVKIFECDKNCKKLALPTDFYNYLEKNKQAFLDKESPVETEIQSKDSKSNHKYVSTRIDFAIKEGKLTNEQENYLKTILQRYKEGAIPKNASKEIKSDIEKTTDSQKVYQSVKQHISTTYLTERKTNKEETNEISEIILSEFLIGG